MHCDRIVVAKQQLPARVQMRAQMAANFGWILIRKVSLVWEQWDQVAKNFIF